MTPILLVCVYLVAIQCSVTTGESEQLQVTVEGTGRVESCIGENITFTCNGLGLAHTWTAPGLLPSTRLIYSFPDVVTSRYTLRSLALDGSVFTSSFTVISDVEFNNTNVTCRDTVGGVQHRIAVVLVPPSSPSLTAVGSGNLVSFIFTLSPPPISPECVLSYTITSTNSDGGMFNISVDANTADPGALLTTIRGGYNLCRYTYSFTVVGVTLVGSGGRSSRINQELVDYSFIGMVTRIQTTSEDLIWSIPSNAPNNCFSHYTVYLEGSSRRLANFTTNMASFVDLDSAGFPTCVRQTITIIPVTMIGTPVTTSSGSMEVYFRDPGIGDPILSVGNDGWRLTLSWMAPATSAVVNVSIWRSSPDSKGCVLDVETRSNTTRTEMTVDCSYAKHNITLCVQFSSNLCVSNNVSITTSELPGLLSYVPVITHEYTTARTIGIMVDVNEGINCLDKDQLYINTSISDSSGVISSSRDFFSDGLILHGILSPGTYTCSVSVMNENETLESVDIPCQTNATFTVLEISLFVIILTLLLVFTLGLLVMWCMKVRKRKSENISRSKEFESKTPSGLMNEIVETHLHQGDDVGTSSGDSHVIHLSPPSGGEGRPVSPPSGGEGRPVSPPSGGEGRPVSPPSCGEGRPVSPSSDPVYDTVSQPREIQLKTNQAYGTVY